MVSVIIPASGSGTRFGGEVPKQFLHINNVPVLARTVMAFQRTEGVGEITVAVPPGYKETVQGMIHKYQLTKVKHIAEGGKSRSESVRAALGMISPRTEIVLVHDGVRPFVSRDLIEKVIDAARLHGAAIAGIPFTDTVKEVDQNGFVYATPERGRFWQIQTPQGFAYEILVNSTGIISDLSGFTDDSAIVEANGVSVYVVPGERGNIKITTQEDMIIAEALLKGTAI
ncbi:MAG: 2-C-methyl-D-erythritol 4-phosphate cytidylyltransferase [Defluviitaleaceae bacterium]|nr:2-C-methyl-D-erythritol 4-phosphate cytidylyltransferase [Defluviitaleaceae bacterium]